MKTNIALAVVLFSFVLALFFTTPTYSQSSSEFDQAYKTYTLSGEEYRKAHDEYILARSQFIKFETLTSQNNARDATIKMLEQRDQVVVDYLLTLIARIKETEGIQETAANNITSRLNDEITWFSDHKGRLSSAGSLDDLVEDSEEASERFVGINNLIYETLSTISLGKENNYRTRLEKSFNDTRDKVNKIKEEDRAEYSFSTRKLQNIDRWVFDTENRLARSAAKQAEAEALFEDFTKNRKDHSSTYNDILKSLGESHQFLKDASLFVKEIIREIKTAE